MIDGFIRLTKSGSDYLFYVRSSAIFMISRRPVDGGSKTRLWIAGMPADHPIYVRETPEEIHRMIEGTG